jgi:hypothetical protein
MVRKAMSKQKDNTVLTYSSILENVLTAASSKLTEYIIQLRTLRNEALEGPKYYGIRYTRNDTK